MDLLAGLMTGRLMAIAATPGPDDDWWYSPVGALTAAGLRIDDEGARKISAWYRGRDILGTSLAMLPLGVYRRLPNEEGSEAAPTHPLHDVLHRKPNAGDDAFTYRRQAMFDLIDHGWHYADIVEGPRGFVDQLHRIDPRVVTPEQIADGPHRSRWLFHVRDPKTGRPTTKTQDDVFYLRGADGKGILDYARDSLGLGIVLQDYASKLFSRGAMNGGILEPPPGPMNEDAMRMSARSWKTAMGDWHMPRILPPGTKFHPASMEPEKAQFILSRKFTVVDIARWLGLPAHMLGEVETAGVTGLEQRGQEFVTISLGGWLSLWEFGINDQLILRPETYFAEFTRDALVRGEIATRWTAYVASVNAGIRTPNEVRRKENLRAMPGGDTLREPQNITGRGAKGGPQDNQRPGRQGDGENGDDRARAIVTESATRVQRKERFAAERAAAKSAGDADAFEAWATEFYDAHVALVAQTMQLHELDAQLYCDSQRDDLIAHGLAATECWTPDFLVGLALDVARPDPRDLLLQAAIERPAPPIQVNAGIEKGAVHVESPTTITTPPVTVTPTTRIEKGAIAVDVGAPTIRVRPAKKGKVTRSVIRDPKTALVTRIEETEE